jgi:hypothetical protein
MASPQPRATRAAGRLLPSLLPLLLPHGALAAAPAAPAAPPAAQRGGARGGGGSRPDATPPPPPPPPGAPDDVAALVAGPALLHPAFRDAADLYALVQRLPKAELHLHIEGTLEPGLLLRLAGRNGVKLPYADEAAARAARAHFSCLQVRRAGARSLGGDRRRPALPPCRHPRQLHCLPTPPPPPQKDFLDNYLACTDVLVTEEDFYELGRDYLARAAAENVRAAEVFLDAQGHIARCARGAAAPGAMAQGTGPRGLRRDPTPCPTPCA